jgi:DNA topoisomerase-3
MAGADTVPPTTADRLPEDPLRALLRRRFAFPEFRPHQEAPCRAAVAGEDVLLVMPTGAGKSLCYQLPGLARNGTTLVVSPLIALMEDQVAKLRDGGLRAERIHSGRARSDSRQVCIDYLSGSLDFLFIAPERLGVSGFPEMLARRRPVLIAIDEAHCISEWGHDFRPDYRMLKQRLPCLRPAPVIALTATATPQVQRDIVAQLGIDGARSFIHGFRRSNIAIELAPVKPSARGDVTVRLLSRPENRPAIVYAPTRKQSQELAERLRAHVRADAYHAGLTAAKRDETQAAFLAGDLEVIVATIAFGMGIDKPDVRTVIHTALPGSVEGYYQEIGRAGRDGRPSRAVLLYGYVDRRTHDYFLERDYPDPARLRQVYEQLRPASEPRVAVEARAGLDPDELDRVLQKLWAHGGVVIDGAENVARGPDDWEQAYLRRRGHKLDQLALIMRYAQSRQCRMLHLVRHFGDQEDPGTPCGQCDVCAPSASLALEFRDPNRVEREAMERIVRHLGRAGAQSTGRLYRELFEKELGRERFERLLGALARAGLLEEREESFEQGGRVIRYRRVFLTRRGREASPAGFADARVLVDDRGPRRRATAAARRKPEIDPVAAEKDAPPALVEALRDWRLAEARRRRVPAFMILSNRVLLGIAVIRPQDEETLLSVKGVGPAIARKHGPAILEIVGRPESAGNAE